MAVQSSNTFGVNVADITSATSLTADNPANQYNQFAQNQSELNETFDDNINSSFNLGGSSAWDSAVHDNAGNGVHYELDETYYGVTDFYLANDALYNAAGGDGIKDFEIVLYDSDGNEVGRETGFTATTAKPPQTFSFSQSYDNVASFDLVINTAYPRKPFQFSEVAIGGADITTTPPPEPIVCFTRGAMILTQKGNVFVEDLQIGDLVETFDGGLQPIRYIYRRCVKSIGEHRPVVFEPGTIGNSKRWRVSQQHRIHTSSFPPLSKAGHDDYLINAIDLVNGGNIRIDTTIQEVEYVHILFDRHELIWSDGVLSESWQPKLRLVDNAPRVRREPESIFPELFAPDMDRLPARKSVVPRMAKGKIELMVSKRARVQ